jgi:hypothetical protein
VTRGVAYTLAALAVLGLLLKGFPGFTQRNAEMIALFLPVHLAFALGVWVIGRAPPPVELERRAAPRGELGDERG